MYYKNSNPTKFAAFIEECRANHVVIHRNVDKNNLGYYFLDEEKNPYLSKNPTITKHLIWYSKEAPAYWDKIVDII